MLQNVRQNTFFGIELKLFFITQSQSTYFLRNYVSRKNILISDMFKLKNRSLRTFCISKGCFPVIMKKHPLEAKHNWPEMEDKTWKLSKRTRLLYSRKAFICNFAKYKKAELQKWNRVPLKYQSSCNPTFSMMAQLPRGRAEVLYAHDRFHFYTVHILLYFLYFNKFLGTSKKRDVMYPTTLISILLLPPKNKLARYSYRV